MSLFQNFRLGLVHLSVTLTFVPVTGVLNRVMIHEFEILASTVALLTVMPYLFSPLQVFIGRYADTHPIAGRRRTPYALAGILLCIGGLQLTPFAAIAIADSAPFAPLLAGAGFGLWGIGYNLAVVSYLSLASELSTPAERPRVVSVMWVMMVLGSIAAAVLIGRALAPYSNTALIGVFQSVGLVSLGCAAIGLWRLEPKAKTAQTRTEVRWSPSEVLATLAKKPEVRIFFIYLVLMLASILGQDVLLEPFAARAFAMSVKDTTHLTAIWGVATLAAMLLYGFLLNRFFSRKQGAQIGLALAACGLLLIAASGLLGLKAAFFIGLATLGLGTGIATATNLALMLGMTPEGQTGVYMGAWGIADALSRALGNFLSGVWRDAMTYLSGNPLVGYVSVFLTQVLLLGVSLWLLQKISEETATPKREDLAESIAIVAEGSKLREKENMHNEQWATEHIKATGAMMEKSPTTARMGPNSVIQTFNAVKARFGDSKAQELLRCAGLDKYSRELPCEMIDEQEFHRLVKSVCETFNEPVRSEILLDAGRRTAYYLLQTRIPKFFQWLLKRLPTRWAAKLLLRSIQRHSWTFAGSGTFDYQVGVAIEAVVVVKCVANDTVAYFYGGALHTLFQTLFKDKTDFKVKVAPSNDGLLCRYSAHIIACQP